MCALLCVGLSMMKGRLAEAWVRRKAKGDTWCSLTPATRCRRTTTSSPPAASSTSAERCGQRRTTALLVRASRQAPLRGSAALSVWDLSAPWGYGRALLLLLFLLFYESSLSKSLRCRSACSVLLHAVSDQPICGNQIVEDGEECDVGHNDTDPCCYSSKESLAIQCRLKPNKQCRYTPFPSKELIWLSFFCTAGVNGFIIFPLGSMRS